MRKNFALPARIANNLFQRGPGDDKYEEPRGSARYALDADPGEAVRHLERARNHVEAARDGEFKLDFERLLDYLEDAIVALESDDANDGDASLEYGDPTNGGPVPREANEREHARSDEHMWAGARQSGGPLTNGRGRREVDHRGDFDSIASRGADSAHGYDESSLFQKK